MRNAHLSLFSGIGGLDLAAEWAGFRTVAFVERDKYCQRVLAKHWPTVPLFPDVTKFCRRVYDCEPETEDGEVLCPRCGTEFGECACVGTDAFVDEHGTPAIISGGFPCQPHSRLGKRQGQADERDLWPDFARVVRELEPRWVVGENVEGAIDTVLDRCCTDLEDMHYQVEAFVCAASAFGAEHRRERLFIVAHLESERMEGVRPEGQQLAQPLARPLLPLRRGDGEWEVEPDVRRTAHGFPRRMDRLRALGNAVVPQQAYPIFKAIAEIEGIAP